MSIESVTHSEFMGMRASQEFSQAIAAIALHTIGSGCEGGFKVARTSDGLAYSALHLPLTAKDNKGLDPREGLEYDMPDNTVVGFHTHPPRRRIHSTDFGNYDLSVDDASHMWRMQQAGCLNFLSGIVAKDETHLDQPGGLVLSLFRTTAPLADDVRDVRAAFEYVYYKDGFHDLLGRSLGIRAARLGLTLVGDDEVQPNNLWGPHEPQLSALFEGDPNPGRKSWNQW